MLACISVIISVPVVMFACVLFSVFVHCYHLCHVENRPPSCVSPVSPSVSCLSVACCIIKRLRPKITCVLFLLAAGNQGTSHAIAGRLSHRQTATGRHSMRIVAHEDRHGDPLLPPAQTAAARPAMPSPWALCGLKPGRHSLPGSGGRIALSRESGQRCKGRSGCR